MKKNILVRIPNWVGDAVMATCFLRALHYGRPEAKVWVVLKSKLRGILLDLPYIHDLIPLHTESFGESVRLGLSLRGKFDSAFILPNSFRSCILPWCAAASERIAYAGQWRGPLLTVPVSPPKGDGNRRQPEPMPHYWKRLLDVAGIEWKGDAPELKVGEESREKARKLARSFGIEDGERFIGLSPGAAFGPSKLWLPERFSRVAALLYKRLGLRSVLFLAPGEEKIAGMIMDHASSPVISTALNPVSLEILKAFVQNCELLITTDSGTRHIGVAFKVPTVTVMGPTDQRYTDYCHDNQAVVYKEMPCRPCHLKICPRDHSCMTSITAEEVVAKALNLLKG